MKKLFLSILMGVLSISFSSSIVLAAVPFKSLVCEVPKANQLVSNIEKLHIFHDVKNKRMQVKVKRRADYWDIYTPWITDDECPTSVDSYLKGKDGNYLPLINCYRKTQQGPVQVQTASVNGKSISYLPFGLTTAQKTQGARFEIILVNSPTKTLGSERKIFRFNPEWCQTYY